MESDGPFGSPPAETSQDEVVARSRFCVTLPCFWVHERLSDGLSLHLYPSKKILICLVRLSGCCVPELFNLLTAHGAAKALVFYLWRVRRCFWNFPSGPQTLESGRSTFCHKEDAFSQIKAQHSWKRPKCWIGGDGVLFVLFFLCKSWQLYLIA